MAAPAVTYTFSNGTTSDASQVNTNFTDLINALTDGTSDIHIGTLNVEGACTFDGAVTLGDASADDITFTGSLASSIPIKTNATYNIGSSTSAPASIYLGNGSNKTLRLLPGTIGTSWTLTFPNDVPTVTGKTLVFNTSGTAEFRYPDKFTASKTGDYTATGDETVILCDASSASFTVTLPAASTMTGKELTIIKTNSDLDKTVTIDANSTETIIPSVQSGQLTYILYTQYESVTLKCNGTSWYVAHHYASTGFTAYTPTTGGLGSPSNVQFAWARSGNMMKVIGSLKTGTVTASTGTISVPGGLSVETTNMPSNFRWNVGRWYGSGTTTAVVTPINSRGPWVGVVKSTDATNVMLLNQVDIDAEGVDLYWDEQGASSVLVSNGPIEVSFEFPIVGWNP